MLLINSFACALNNTYWAVDRKSTQWPEKIEIFETIFSGITKTQWRSRGGGRGNCPSLAPNEITLCTEVYREPPFWVPVIPSVHPWAPLASHSFWKVWLRPCQDLFDLWIVRARSFQFVSRCFIGLLWVSSKYTHTMPVHPRVALWAIKPKKKTNQNKKENKINRQTDKKKKKKKKKN